MNRPTEKQITYIVALVSGRREDDAYREIAKVCNISTSAARRRATKQDASRTIEALKDTLRSE